MLSLARKIDAYWGPTPEEKSEKDFWFDRSTEAFDAWEKAVAAGDTAAIKQAEQQHALAARRYHAVSA